MQTVSGNGLLLCFRSRHERTGTRNTRRKRACGCRRYQSHNRVNRLMAVTDWIWVFILYFWTVLWWFVLRRFDLPFWRYLLVQVPFLWFDGWVKTWLVLIYILDFWVIIVCDVVFFVFYVFLLLCIWEFSSFSIPFWGGISVVWCCGCILLEFCCCA